MLTDHYDSCRPTAGTAAGGGRWAGVNTSTRGPADHGRVDYDYHDNGAAGRGPADHGRVDYDYHDNDHHDNDHHDDRGGYNDDASFAETV